MIRIYHNPRCSKSREGLKLVQDSGMEFETKEYLKEPLNEKEIKSLLEKLKMTPIQIVRKNESAWKEKFKGKDLSDVELIRILSENPKLIERPILENDTSAVIGRPVSNIETFLKNER